MTRMSGHPLEMFISWSFRCPYQAKVIQMFEPIKSNMHQNAFMSTDLSLYLTCIYSKMLPVIFKKLPK